MPAQITERLQHGVAVLGVSGRITMGEGCHLLEAKLQEQSAGEARKVLLDLSGVDLLDSQGIRVLVRGLTSIEKGGGKLKLLNPSRKARMVLDLTRLLEVFEAFEDEAQALRSFD